MADEWNLDQLEPIEPSWDVSTLPAIEGTEALDTYQPEGSKPKATVGRILRRFGASVKATPANVSAAARSEAQTADLSKPSPPAVSEASARSGRVGIPDMSGRSIGAYDPKTQSDIQLNLSTDTFGKLPDAEQAQVLTEASRLVSEGKDSRSAFTESLREVNRNRIIDQSIKMETIFALPEEFKQSSGILEDVAGVIGTSIASLPFYAMGPLTGAASNYMMIKGAKVQELEEMGAEPKMVEKAASFSALVQTPLESLINVKMLSAILKPAKTWVGTLVKIGETQVGEGITEFIQQYPDEYATIMAMNPQADGSDLAAKFVDALPEITSEAAYSGLVGFLSAGVTTGAGVAARNAINALTTSNQRAETDVAQAEMQSVVQRIQDGVTSPDDLRILSGIFGEDIRENISIDQIIEKAGDFADIIAPIESPARTEVLKGINKTLETDQAQAITVIYDQMARSHAITNGVETSSFYDLFTFQKAEQDVDGELFQEGPKKEPADVVVVLKTEGPDTGSIDVEATKASLPPAPENTTRLFRAESPTVKFSDVFETEGLEDLNPKTPGKHYTADMEYADYYRTSYGPDAVLSFVDIENSALAKLEQTPEGSYILEPQAAPATEKAQKRGPKAAVKGAFEAAGQKTITAFQGADVSTPVHEIAHVKLSLMTVENPDDYYALAEWAGVQRTTAETLDLKNWSTGALEKVAKGFEVYMIEGRAPTTKLQAIFSQMKEWMLQIYGSVRTLNIELSDEVRAVYDSWLAAGQERTSEAATEIDEWLRVGDLDAIKFDPLTASYDDVTWEARRRVLSGIVDKRTSQDANIRARLKKQAKEDVDARPEYQLLAAIREKGLNAEAMKEALTPEVLAELRRRAPASVREEGGDPMEIMVEFGFSGIDEMTAAIIAVKTKKFAVAQRIGQLQAGFRATLKAENTKLYRDIIQEELKILEEITGTKAGEVTDFDVSNMDDQQIIADIRSDNTLVKAAMVSGNVQEALRLKAIQKEKISNIYEKKKEQQKRGALDRRMMKHWKSKTAPEEYRAQAAKFLGEFYTIPDAHKANPSEGLAEFLRRKALGGNVTAAASIIPDLFGVPTQRIDSRGHRIPLTLKEKQLVARVADQLIHMGREEKVVLHGLDKLEFETELNKKVLRGYETAKITPEEFSLDPVVRSQQGVFRSATDGLSQSASDFNAWLRRMEFDLELMDGGIDGPNAEIFKGIVKAEAQELLLGERLNQKFKDIMSPYDAVWSKKMYKIPGTEVMLSKEQLFLVALNSKSSGNRMALMGANDPSLTPAQRQNLINKNMTGNNLTEGQIDEIVNNILTADEMASVSQIWDMFEELYPLLNEIHKALNGVPLKKVDGKYFPMVIDRKLSTQSAEYVELDKLYNPFMNPYTQASVDARSRVERVGGKQPLQLTISVITQSMSRSIHDITHQIPVRNAMRFIEDGRYAQMVTDVLGAARYRQMREWVKYVARPVQPIDGGIDKFFQFIRRNATVAHLGFKVTVAMKQVLSYTQVIDELNKLGYSGAKEAALGLQKFYADVEGGVEFTNASSVFMRNRTRNWDRDAGEILSAAENNPFSGPLKKQMFQFFMSLTSLGDKAAVYPAWTAGYTVGMREFGNDHAKAAEFADRLVRVTQPSNSPKDLSAAQRGNELSRLITMFQGFFNMYYQRIGDTFTQHRLGQIDTFQLFKSIWWTTILPAVIPGLIGGGYAAATGEPPEPEEFLFGLGKDLITFPTASVPILREIAGKVVTGRKYSLTPVESAFDTAAMSIEVIVDGIDPGEDVNLDRARRNGINLMGYLFGIPSAQINTTADGIIRLMSGETANPLELLVRAPHKSGKKKKRMF